ncbi:MAG: hypothetical protein AAFO76_16325, partial [Cyanobacteria bacterium J06607_15]
MRLCVCLGQRSRINRTSPLRLDAAICGAVSFRKAFLANGANAPASRSDFERDAKHLTSFAGTGRECARGSVGLTALRETDPSPQIKRATTPSLTDNRGYSCVPYRNDSLLWRDRFVL